MDSPANNWQNLGKALCVLHIVLLLTAWCAATPAGAEIYRWKDENGVWHYSDRPTADDKTPKSFEPTGEIASPPRPVRPAETPATSLPPADAAPANPSSAQDPDPAPLEDSGPAPPVSGGLLWKISKGGQGPSYLLGTIHSTDPRVTRLKTAVADALDGSDRFIMEMELDTSVIMQFGATMMMGPGADLEEIIGAGMFKRVVTAMAGVGMPEMLVRQMKPWVVMAILSMPPTSGGMILDMALRQRAADQGKPTSGLETAQEQFGVFEGLSLEDQIELLELTLDHRSSQPAMFEKLIRAYAADDLARIARIAGQYNNRAPSPATRRFMRRLNDERNVRMVQRMMPYLEQSSSFIAVGALHLTGRKGILTQLRDRGYAVTSVR